MTQLHKGPCLSGRKLNVLCQNVKYQNDTSLHINFKPYVCQRDIMKNS